MNSVVIMGLDHSNTLGVIRSLGENGIKPYVYIISEKKSISVKHSKYCYKTVICKDEEEAIFTMIQEFDTSKEKIVVIPTSDRAASILDSNYERLSKKFILHNIDNCNNKINLYMDKYEQYKLAIENDVLMAKSQVMFFPFEEKIDGKMKFPVIIKPLVSAEGAKTDISIANTKEMLIENLLKFKNDNYKSVIIQEFIEFDYECDMSGYIYNNEISISGFIKKNRIWPLKKGSLTYGTVKCVDMYEKQINKITSLLQKINYTGLFDIEFFVKGNDVYLNEINFRNSGLTYLYDKSYICYHYYLSCVNNKFIPAPRISEEYNVMDEQAEIHQILDRNISYKEHKKDKKNTKLLLVSNKKDSKPGRIMIYNKIINNLGLEKLVLLFEKGIHKNKETYLLKATQNDIKKLDCNKDYKILELDDNTIDLLPDFKKDIINEYNKGNVKGIILMKDDEYVGRGVIKSKGAQDRFISLKNSNSYLVGNMYVYPKYRGKNYQCDIVCELVNRFVNDKEYNLYSVVYKYNIPSWKNFLKIGFKIYKEFQIIRVFKKTINKQKV